MATLNDWDVVDANNNAAPPAGWPENTMQYSEVNDTGRAVQGTLKRYFADVNGSLSAGGVADAYTVNLNESGYTAYFTGMYFACQINTTNTGASTIDVNSIGVQNIVNDDGSALAAGTLEAGGIYEFRYDGTDFQVTGVTAGQSVSVGQAIFSNSNDPDLVDTDVAINAGASDPDTAQHIEIGPSDIQSKSDATTAALLSLNALGGDVSICETGGNVLVGPQSGSGIVTLYADAETSLLSNIAGIYLYGSVATATPPTTESATTRIIMFDQDGSDELLFFGFPSTQNFQMTNRMHGGSIEIKAEDTAGAEQFLFSAAPDGAANLFFDGGNRLNTRNHGIQIDGSVASSTPPVNADPVDSYLTLFDTGSNRLSYYGHSGDGTLQIANEVHGSEVRITAQDAVGTARLCAVFRPAADQIFYYNGALTCATLPAASGGFQVNNTLTGGGLERVLTTSDLGGAAVLSGCTVTRTDALYSAPVGVFAIPFVSEEFDDANWHDNVTNNTRLTVPAGISRVQLSGGVRTATGDQHTGKLYIAKNGSRNYDGIGFELNTTAIGGVLTGGIGCVTAWLAVTPGDYFELQFDNDEASAVNLDDNFTWFSVIGY